MPNTDDNKVDIKFDDYNDKFDYQEITDRVEKIKEQERIEKEKLEKDK